SFNKGITVHNTQNAEVRDNVVYETISHNYYLEQRETYDNVLTGNLGMNARDVGRFGEIRGASDNNPSNFYTTNGHNSWIDNHAAGSDDKGFYFSLGRGEHGARDFDTFVGNTAHSTDGRAFYLNHAGLIQDGNPRGSAEQPQKVDPWVAEGFTTYKSDGVYVRGVEGTFTDSAFAEMGSNARFRLNQTIEDSLIVGRSDNIGNPQTDAEIAAGRSLPGGDGNFQGFQLYDGPGSLSNVMFDGFTEPGDGAIELSNAIHKSSSFGLEGITFGEDVAEANKLSIGGGGNAIGVDSWARGLVDVDGSITGTPGAMIYQYSSDRDGSRVFNAGEDYEIIEEWGAIVSYGTRSGTLRIDRLGTDAENTGNQSRLDHEGMVVTRSDGESATGIRVQIPVFIDYGYEVAYDAIEDDFRLYLHDMDWGDSIVVSLPDTPTDASFIIDDPYSSAARPAREVSSMAMLEASPDTAVFRDGDGVVHVKLVAEMAHGYLWPQPGAAMPGSLHSGVTLLVDTKAGLDLDALVFDDPGPDDVLPPPPYAEGQAPDAPPTPPANVAPEAADDAAETVAGTPVVVDVLANDSDADGGTLRVVSADGGDDVTVEIVGEGTQLRLTPGAGVEGETRVTYEISDGQGGTATAEVVLDVAPAPEEPAPVPPTDEPSGDTVMAYVETGGAVVIEAESHPDLPAGWVTKATYDRTTAPDLGALGGRNDFVMWQGADQSDAPGEAVLTYHVLIETPGLYEFELRDQPATDRPEVGGDTWVKIDGARFYGRNGDSTMYPEGAAPGSFPPGSEPLPAADGEDGWMRYQSTNRSTHWGGGGHVNDTGQRSDRHDIVVAFETPGLYSIQLAGATPSSHAIGAIGLVNRDVASEFSLQGEVSAQAEVALDSVPAAPANSDPVARDDTASTPMGQRVEVAVKQNDSDADGDNLTIGIIDGPENGTAEVRNGSIRYTPDDGFFGTDTVTYRLSDPFGGSDTATFTIDVRLPEVPATGPVHLANANGNYVFEAESAIDQDRAGGWEFRSADELPEGHDAPTGTGYIQATSGNSFREHRNPEEDPESLLTYRFRAEKDGFVQINLVASNIGDDPTEHNDTWTGILKDGVPVPAVAEQGGAELEPRGDLGLYKTYQSGGSSNDFRVANRNIDNVGRAIVVPVEEGEVYTLVLMERSAGHEIDRIVLTYHAEGDSVGAGRSGNSGPLQAEPLSTVEGAPPADPPADDPPADDPPADDPPVGNSAPVAVDDAVSLAYQGRRTVDVLANDTDADDDALTITGVSASAGLSAEIVEGGVRVTAAEGFAGEGSVTYTITDGAETDEGAIAVSVAAPDPVAIELVLYDAALDEAIATLGDGATVELDAAALDALTIVATPAGRDVESVRFDLNTSLDRVENHAPYALFGDSGGDLA
ncbi:MAG: Ig-like domain-containing protein, partial [Pseudomonadota bacterium]